MNVFPTVLILALLLPLTLCWSLWLVFACLALLPPRSLARARRRPRDAPLSILETRGTVWGELTPPQLSTPRFTIDVLIPAHNEHDLLPLLLQSLQQQTPAGLACLGTILVVADHCTDDTAGIARRFAATALERSTGPRGKPAALRDGIAALTATAAADPRRTASRAVAIVDADCTVSVNFLEELARAMDAGHRVAQTTNLVDQPHAAYSLSTIAFALKNLIRPKGMARMGIPTQLFGTGMCFDHRLLAIANPGHRAATAPLRFSDHLTEDLAISHELLLRKIPPVFLPQARVRSPIPTDKQSLATQKLRWETGQLHTWKKLPLTLMKLLADAQFKSALALLDWSAPPLAMAVIAWFGITVLAILFTLLHLAPWQVLLAPAVTLAILVAYIILGTLQVAGAAAVVHLAISIPRFFLWKLALYARMATGKGTSGWQKSRSAPSAAETTVDVAATIAVQPARTEVHT